MRKLSTLQPPASSFFRSVTECIDICLGKHKNIKRSPLTLSPVVSDSKAWCSSLLPSHRASGCLKTVSVVTWPMRLDMERHYLPIKVVPIYLLAFLHAFKFSPKRSISSLQLSDYFSLDRSGSRNQTGQQQPFVDQGRHFDKESENVPNGPLLLE